MEAVHVLGYIALKYILFRVRTTTSQKLEASMRAEEVCPRTVGCGILEQVKDEYGSETVV